MSEEIKCCENCKFWEIPVEEMEDKIVEEAFCRRFPPVLDQVWLSKISNRDDGMYDPSDRKTSCPWVQPVTQAWGWCGEFRSKSGLSENGHIELRHLNFSIRVRKLLIRHELETINDVVRIGTDELKKSRNFGFVSLGELREKLRQFGVEIPTGKGHD